MIAPDSDSPARPVLSVIVVSFNATGLLEQCVAALVSQSDAAQIEICIISKQQQRDLGTGDGQHPQIHWQQVADSETIPSMRRIGIEQSTADLTALIEDDCIVGPQWLQAILSAHQQGSHPVVGGAIEPGRYKRGLDWGIFYCEFGRFLEPFSGTVTALPGNNVCYAANILDPRWIRSGLYEVFVHQKIQNAGSKLIAASGMQVTNINAWRFADCSINPFHHGRAYAGQRFGDRFSGRCLIYGLLAIVLPVVKSYRTIREIRSRKRTDLPLIRALPWILVFQTCWSVGEIAGYLTGPGSSLKKWV